MMKNSELNFEKIETDKNRNIKKFMKNFEVFEMKIYPSVQGL